MGDRGCPKGCWLLGLVDALSFRPQRAPPWPHPPSWGPQLEGVSTKQSPRYHIRLTVVLHVRSPEGEVVTEELHDEGRVPAECVSDKNSCQTTSAHL